MENSGKERRDIYKKNKKREKKILRKDTAVMPLSSPATLRLASVLTHSDLGDIEEKTK